MKEPGRKNGLEGAIRSAGEVRKKGKGKLKMVILGVLKMIGVGLVGFGKTKKRGERSRREPIATAYGEGKVQSQRAGKEGGI